MTLQMLLLLFCALFPIGHAFTLLPFFGANDAMNVAELGVIINNNHYHASSTPSHRRNKLRCALASSNGNHHDDAAGKEEDDAASAVGTRRRMMQDSSSDEEKDDAAAMTDETASFASPSTDASYRQRSPPSSASPSAPSEGSSSSSSSYAPSVPSDEITVAIDGSDLRNMRGSGLGLELGEVSFRTNFRVIVRSVAPNSLAERRGIRPGWIVVSVNGADVERTNASGVSIYFKRAVESALSSNDAEAGLSLTFRDPARFRDDLANFPTTTTTTTAPSTTTTAASATDGGNGAASTTTTMSTTSTKVAPAGDTTQRNADGSLRRGASSVVTEQSDQIVTITQLVPPKTCHRRATTDDLLEISYVGRVLETGTIFDGSAVRINGDAIPGRGNDISMFFVLGKQPFGQFPPGWDVGLEGMCVGERRRLVIPPVLAYGATGVPRRGIPPNATLQYDITLVSMNGLATPQ
eukprot:CAMPEP_0181136068 /NCGR_PEP_ID=MMETSP1071-20121207/32988_1 /TAXON_ID=35127 /ORGANISM="Thalassiosira sp., Strain NH16" /LENGTH=465 /DNA_ID=CAMNT_0023222757 /DNA_START=57 /DNA_END=1455 /DNA_ORIENTATION=+